MKKVLILAYDFPPYVSVGGLRPYNWYKYLKEYGVEPIVVTRQWENKYGNELDYIAPSLSKEIVIEKTKYGTIIRSPYFPSISNQILFKNKDHRLPISQRLLTVFDELRQFITISGPKKQLYLAAKKYLQENKVDVIIATGDPFVLFFYAKKLSQHFNIPWIADYRDPWSQDVSRSRNVFLRTWNKRIEQKIVNTSSSISTVSEFVKKQIETNIKNKSFYILPNGYDPEVIDEIAQMPQSTEKLTFSFVGTIYDWHPWKSFITIFSTLLEEQKEQLQLNLYGINKTDEVNTFLQSFPEKTKASIQIFPRLPNNELLHKIAQENVALLFNDYSYLGTKIFDYIAIKRQILFCYSNDKNAIELKSKFYTITEREEVSQKLQEELIIQKNAGIIVENSSHLMTILTELHSEFQQTGQIKCNSLDIEEFSRKVQTGKLVEIIKNSIN